jgi:endonuclease/exonuclease/phosphatase (EEP) superfamily protein YafD
MKLRVWLDQLIGISVIAAIACSALGYAAYNPDFERSLDLLTHFKVQYFIWGWCGFFFFLLRQKPNWVGLSLLLVTINLVAIAPWYVSPPQSFTAPSYRLKVLSLNVNVKTQNPAPAISLIESEAPDLVALVEVNQRWLDAFKPIKKLYPYSVQSAHAKRFGIVFYSKFPIEKMPLSLNLPSPPSDLSPSDLSPSDLSPSDLSDLKDTYLASRLVIDGRTIEAIAIHPPPPKGDQLTTQRNQVLTQVSQYVGKKTGGAKHGGIARERSTPAIIVLGDFNTTLWSPVYQRFETVSGLRNTRQGFGILPTWNAFFLPSLIPIDHCLISKVFQVQNITTGANVGSDHLPLIVDLQY